MTQAEKSNLLKQNTLCWLAALVTPLILHFGLSSTKFPWPLTCSWARCSPRTSCSRRRAARLRTKQVRDTTHASHRPGRGGEGLLAVREVWQGTCMRTNFTVPPPDGHIRATASPGSLAGGYLLFSAAHNHRSNGTFGSFDAGVPVKDG